MNKESGVRDFRCINDFRVIEEAAANGNKRAQLALNMFHYKVRRVIGAFCCCYGWRRRYHPLQLVSVKTVSVTVMQSATV